VDDLVIKAVTEADMDRLLPLIADYQRFYRVDPVDNAGNRTFFSHFAHNPEQGIQHIAITSHQAVGFSTLYFSYCSLEAAPVATLYDLYVRPELRGQGIGRALLDNAAAVARQRGMKQMIWFTSPDNHVAQRLYDRIKATRSEWIQYTMALE